MIVLMEERIILPSQDAKTVRSQKIFQDALAVSQYRYARRARTDKNFLIGLPEACTAGGK